MEEKILQEKLKEVLSESTGRLRIDDDELKKEVETFILADMKRPPKLGASILGIKESQYYTLRARIKDRLKKKMKRDLIRLEEVKIKPSVSIVSEEIKIVTGTGIRIEVQSASVAIKILEALKC